MANEELTELDEFMAKLDQAGDDESAIEKIFEEAKSNNSSELTAEELSEVSGGRYGVSLNDMIDFLLKGEGGAKLTWKSLSVASRCLYDGVKYGNPYKTYSESYVKKLGSDLEAKIPGWMKKVAELG